MSNANVSAELASSVKKGVPMIVVPDIAAALDWYASMGFTEIARYADDDEVSFGMVSFGNAELMFRIGSPPQASDSEWLRHDVTLWFYTDAVDSLYRFLKSRGGELVEDIYNPFYGGRQFSIRDPYGYILIFLQPDSHETFVRQ